jgi:hypothetical protein
VKVLLINNDGSGFADRVELPEGTTVFDLFHRTVKHRGSEDYLIRGNRQPAAPDEFLKDGDRISVTPLKIKGAA